MAPPAPLDPDALAAALRPFGSSRALPAAAYTSTEVLDWERRHLFAGGWTCVGRTAELFDGATHRAVVVGDIGVLLTDEGGTVRAFANVCRHRAHELLPEGGAADRRAVVCPYHGWAYRLDGTHLKGLDEHLVALPATDWDGWLLVNATGDGEPFEEYLGALDDLLAPYRMNELTLGARHTYRVAANWKVLVENYHECDHCPQIHPELCKVSPPTSGDNWDLPGRWVGGSMTLRPHAETMSLSGRGSGVRILDAPQGTVRYVVAAAQPAALGPPGLCDGAPPRAARAGPHRGRVQLVFPVGRRRPGLRRRLLGPDQPAGLGRLRVGAARAELAAFPARPARRR